MVFNELNEGYFETFTVFMETPTEEVLRIQDIHVDEKD